MRIITLLLTLAYIPQATLGNMALQTLKAEQSKLQKQNKTLKNKNIELKKTKEKFEKQKKVFGITTAVTGAAAITTTAGAIIANKNKKKINKEIVQKQKELKTTIQETIDLTNCKRSTKTIFEAIDQNNLTELQCWLFKEPESKNAEKGITFKYTPLPYSIDKDKTEAAKIILKHDPKLTHLPMKSKDLIISYPLLNALSKGNRILTQMLLENKADLYAKLSSDESVLTAAVDFVQTENQSNFLRILDDLHKQGYDLNTKDNNGDTILTKGLIGGRFYTNYFRSLYEKNYMDRTIKNNKGNNILHLMIPYCDSARKPSDDPINRHELLERVAKENKALLSQTNNNGNTPLQEAQKQRKQNLVNVFEKVEKELH